MRCDNDDLDNDDFDFTYIPPAIITFTCICEVVRDTEIGLMADQTFGDLAVGWLDRNKGVLKGRSLESMEWGEHLMELDRAAEIQSNALILKEEKAKVYFTLKK